MADHPDPVLILASASPRRSELLIEAGITFEVIPAEVVEIPEPGESASACAERLAKLKAETIAQRFPGRWVLGADTVVTLKEHILGKPESDEEALKMLAFLSGQTHQVLTAIAFCQYPAGSGDVRLISKVITSEVVFRTLTEAEIKDYVATGEPLDKAGAYAIQGGAGRFVSSFRGSWSNIVGLPIEEVRELLNNHLRNSDNRE